MPKPHHIEPQTRYKRSKQLKLRLKQLVQRPRKKASSVQWSLNVMTLQMRTSYVTPPIHPLLQSLSHHFISARPIILPNPIKESSDVEMADDCDLHSEGSVVGDSEVESAAVPSPAKKRKANARKGALLKVAATKKAIAKMAGKKAIVKMAGKKATVKTASKKKFEESDVETVDSEAELVKVPKPKKEKVWVQDDINIAAKAIEEKDSSGNKYANMLKSMVSNGGKADGQLAIKVLSLSQGIAVEEKKV